ncbi:oxidoreductase-like protein [Xylariales sp. PMI_506]|nr:oxidoreductase-like protein [Xylariales sp. PMI_506]
MGLFDYFRSPDDKRAEEVRSGAVAPDRTERKKCWEARDGYFLCLDKADVINALEGEGKRKSEKHCAKESAVFERDCAAAWVKYFKKYRVAEYQKKKAFERLEHEGAKKMTVDSGPSEASQR